MQLLSEYKYDEYQQFSPGLRFIESLSLWLYHFKDTGKQNLAYDLFKKHLIFISIAELHHLIKITYPDFIKQYLIDHFSTQSNISNIFIKKIINDQAFHILRRKCLFLGLSDGARTDIFRRFSGLKHEQVYPTYLITEEKSIELLEELNEDLTINKYGLEKFNIVFLLDDFSASGISYLRKNSVNEFKGKIQKFYQQLKLQNDESSNFVRNLFDMSNLKICVVLYVATTKAKKKIEFAAEELMKLDNIVIDVIVIQEIDDSLGLTDDDLGDLSLVLSEKFDPDVSSKHYKKGKHEKPYLGFDECGLPLIMSHNCPNNSLPIFWHETTDKKYRALFPRLQRYTV